METLGYIHFDRAGANNYISEMLTIQEKTDLIFRNKYVKVEESSDTNSKTFIGRIAEGPFYMPEEVGRDSAIAQVPVLRGDTVPILPRYYALEYLEIIGEYVERKLVPSRTRPRPKSKVSELDPEIIRDITGSRGKMFIGKLDGYHEINIYMDAEDKKLLPRNLGIFGTVGSGKSNTAQVIVEEALKADYAVVLFDVEGEYVNMDRPTTELHDRLSNCGLEPKGIEEGNFEVVYPAPGESSKEGAKPFTIKFSDLDLYILFELVHATEAQERSFSAVVEELEKEKSEGSSEDGPLAKSSENEKKPWIDRAITKIFEMVDQKKINTASGHALAGKLAFIKRLGIIDVPNVQEFDEKQVLKPGKLTVIDVSSCSEYVKNISIAHILKKVFDAKIADPKAPKTMIVIEEAHTFISRENRDKMEATIDMLKVIARRGRKRWLSLCFVSQQPSHIPDEIFELCNSRIIHAIKSQPNLTALKNTTGNVISETWNQVVNLGQGQALVITPQYTHPLVVNIRPACSMRKFVD